MYTTYRIKGSTLVKTVYSIKLFQFYLTVTQKTAYSLALGYRVKL